MSSFLRFLSICVVQLYMVCHMGLPEALALAPQQKVFNRADVQMAFNKMTRQGVATTKNLADTSTVSQKETPPIGASAGGEVNTQFVDSPTEFIAFSAFLGLSIILLLVVSSWTGAVLVVPLSMLFIRLIPGQFIAKTGFFGSDKDAAAARNGFVLGTLLIINTIVLSTTAIGPFAFLIPAVILIASWAPGSKFGFPSGQNAMITSALVLGITLAIASVGVTAPFLMLFPIVAAFLSQFLKDRQGAAYGIAGLFLAGSVAVAAVFQPFVLIAPIVLGLALLLNSLVEGQRKGGLTVKNNQVKFQSGTPRAFNRLRVTANPFEVGFFIVMTGLMIGLLLPLGAGSGLILLAPLGFVILRGLSAIWYSGLNRAEQKAGNPANFAIALGMFLVNTALLANFLGPLSLIFPLVALTVYAAWSKSDMSKGYAYRLQGQQMVMVISAAVFSAALAVMVPGNPIFMIIPLILAGISYVLQDEQYQVASYVLSGLMLAASVSLVVIANAYLLFIPIVMGLIAIPLTQRGEVELDPNGEQNIQQQGQVEDPLAGIDFASLFGAKPGAQSETQKEDEDGDPFAGVDLSALFGGPQTGQESPDSGKAQPEVGEQSEDPLGGLDFTELMKMLGQDAQMGQADDNPQQGMPFGLPGMDFGAGREEPGALGPRAETAAEVVELGELGNKSPPMSRAKLLGFAAVALAFVTGLVLTITLAPAYMPLVLTWGLGGLLIVIPGYLFHEYRHYEIARKYGAQTKESEQRFTWSNLIRGNFDLSDAKRLLKPVTFDPYKVDSAAKQRDVAAAGPLANLAVAAVLGVVAILAVFVGPGVPLVAIMLLAFGAEANLYMALYNFLPLHKTHDGFKILNFRDFQYQKDDQGQVKRYLVNRKGQFIDEEGKLVPLGPDMIKQLVVDDKDGRRLPEWQRDGQGRYLARDGQGIGIRVGAVTAYDFASLNIDADALFKELVDKSYVDLKDLEAKPPKSKEQFELSESFKDQSDAVWDILQRRATEQAQQTESYEYARAYKGMLFLGTLLAGTLLMLPLILMSAGIGVVLPGALAFGFLPGIVGLTTDGGTSAAGVEVNNRIEDLRGQQQDISYDIGVLPEWESDVQKAERYQVPLEELLNDVIPLLPQRPESVDSPGFVEFHAQSYQAIQKWYQEKAIESLPSGVPSEQVEAAVQNAINTNAYRNKEILKLQWWLLSVVYGKGILQSIVQAHEQSEDIEGLSAIVKTLLPVYLDSLKQPESSQGASSISLEVKASTAALSALEGVMQGQEQLLASA